MRVGCRERECRGRNEDCWCGSGRKYKHCHYQIDMAAEHQKYAAAQDVYARNWVGTAQHNYEDDVYHWFAEALAGYSPKRILDVGCGSGHGLVALREVLGPDTQIVALDEKPVVPPHRPRHVAQARDRRHHRRTDVGLARAGRIRSRRRPTHDRSRGALRFDRSRRVQRPAPGDSAAGVGSVRRRDRLAVRRAYDAPIQRERPRARSGQRRRAPPLRPKRDL